MKISALLLFYLTIISVNSQNSVTPISQSQPKESDSPIVDYKGFLELAKEVEAHRAERLLTLDQYLKMAEEPNTIILDTRSKRMYDRKHLKGAIHLNFNEFDQFSLDEIMNRYAGKNTKILIYCNNNFKDQGNVISLNQTKVQNIDPAFISKMVIPEYSKSVDPLTNFKGVSLALNIPTYINLYGYGYKNVYELGEMIDVKDFRIAFEGSDLK